MKKMIIFVFLIFILLNRAYPVLAEEVFLGKDILEKILKRQEVLEKQQELHLKKIEQLEKELNEMKKEREEVSKETVKHLEKENKNIQKRLDVVEKKSILDKIQFSGDFRTRFDSMRFNNVMVGDEKIDGYIDELWTTRLRLLLRSDISENLIFHSRLRYEKLWGIDNNFGNITDAVNSCNLPDSQEKLHVERAYVDFFVPDTPLSITFGRLPTLDGPPYEYRNYTTRKATWPSLFVNSQNDGIILNFSLNEWTGLKDSMVRFGYTLVYPFFKRSDGLNNIKNMRAGYLGFETECPGIKDSLLWLGYCRISGMPPPNLTSPKSLGDLDAGTIHLQFDNIFDSHLDFFASFTYDYIHAKSEGAEIEPGYEVGFLGDNQSGTLGEDREGYAFYTGLRYRLPIDMLNNPLVGFEYNHGSKYLVSMTFIDGDEEIPNKLTVKGNAYELYYIQPIIKERMFCRLGWIYMDHQYHNPNFFYGEVPESDINVKNFYFLTDVRF